METRKVIKTDKVAFTKYHKEHQEFIRQNKRIVIYMKFDYELEEMRKKFPKENYKEQEKILDSQLGDIVTFVNKMDQKYITAK